MLWSTRKQIEARKRVLGMGRSTFLRNQRPMKPVAITLEHAGMFGMVKKIDPEIRALIDGYLGK